MIFIIKGFRTIVFIFLFPQRFGRYVLRPSSGVCRTREPTQNFELRPLSNPRGSPVPIPLTITGYKTRHIDRNVVEITIKMKTTVRKPLMKKKYLKES